MQRSSGKQNQYLKKLKVTNNNSERGHKTPKAQTTHTSQRENSYENNKAWKVRNECRNI